MNKKPIAAEVPSITKSRRERERSARRQEILKIAREVFSEKSFYQATLEEIAERAEFAKGTIYGYFTSKEDLFECLIAEELDLLENELKTGFGISKELPWISCVPSSAPCSAILPGATSSCASI